MRLRIFYGATYRLYGPYNPHNVHGFIRLRDTPQRGVHPRHLLTNILLGNTIHTAWPDVITSLDAWIMARNAGTLRVESGTGASSQLERSWKIQPYAEEKKRQRFIVAITSDEIVVKVPVRSR